MNVRQEYVIVGICAAPADLNVVWMTNDGTEGDADYENGWRPAVASVDFLSLREESGFYYDENGRRCEQRESTERRPELRDIVPMEFDGDGVPMEMTNYQFVGIFRGPESPLPDWMAEKVKFWLETMAKLNAKKK